MARIVLEDTLFADLRSIEERIKVLERVASRAQGGDSYYVHSQIAPLKAWVVTHDLGRYPTVTVIDSAGSVVVGDVQYISANQLTITFTAEFAGRVILS